MLVHWIWLATRPNMSDRQRAAVLNRFSDPEEIFFGDSDSIRTVEGMTEEAALSLQDRNLTASEEILRRCADRNIHICTYADAAYPARLRSIADPPMVLYYKGHLPNFDGNPVIAVVGTRKASAYGLTAAKRMGYQLAKCGAVVVSGLAFGIDGVAMAGAMTAGGTVVGVLGCGVDIVYPASNKSLFADTERCGCLISEFPPGTEPFKWNFPKRNRIISGLSCGVLVVEAPEKSGSLITARQAAEQGRDVFVVPGNIDVESFMGSNALLKDGAIVATSGWDVLSEYQALYPNKIRKYTGGEHQTGYADEVSAAADAEKTLPKVAQKTQSPKRKRIKTGENDKKPIDKDEKPPYIDLDANMEGLSAQGQQIVKLLREEDCLVDDLIAQTGFSTGRVLAELTMLEIRGIITRLPGKRVRLKYQGKL